MSTETMERPVAAAPVAALTPPQRAAVALNTAEYEIKLRELLTNSVGILAVTNKAGRDECHTAYMVLKNTRRTITNLSEGATEDAKAFTKAVKAEAVRLIAITTAEEDRLLTLRDGWDDAEQARKDALIAAERARTEGIGRDIDTFADMVFDVAGKSSSVIGAAIDELAKVIVTPERFAEFSEDATATIAASLLKLSVMRDDALASEAATLAAEEARKDAEKRAADEAAAVAAQRAENERVANEHAATAKRLADQETAQALVAKQLADKAAANLRAENEARDTQVRLQREAQEKNRMALSQIEAIRHQAVIAEVGRSPYVKGGDAASYLFVLAETRAWVIDDEQFGVMTASAQMVKDSTIVMLEQGLALYMAVDHAEALLEDAQFDADREAQREQEHHDSIFRLQAAADQHLTDNLPPPESCCARDARIDSGEEDGMGDEDIIEFGKEWDLDLPSLIARMERFVVDQRELAEAADALPGGQHYSTTTFKDNGEPILLNADGTRSIFCDLCD